MLTVSEQAPYTLTLIRSGRCITSCRSGSYCEASQNQCEVADTYVDGVRQSRGLCIDGITEAFGVELQMGEGIALTMKLRKRFLNRRLDYREEGGE